jgi:FlaG/FlaF family flagellin (archaellin)
VFKIIIGLAGLALIAAGAYGFAAPLTVTSTTLEAGGTDALTCDDAVSVNWNVQWQNSPSPDMYVHEVHVTGVDSACADKSVVITLTATNGNFLAQGTVTADGVTDPTYDFGSQNITVSSVGDVHVAIIN